MSDLQMQFIYVLLWVATVVSTGLTHRIEKRSEKCILPPFPKNGHYARTGYSSAKPGDETDSASLTVTCDLGYSITGNNVVTCTKGFWSTHMPHCDQCGRIPEDGVGLPWHVSIRKSITNSNYRTICAGSIISNNIIITAALCFSPKASSKIDFSLYTVVAEATHQSWDVSEIKFPERYQGISSNFQSDIALMMLKTPLEYSTNVQPVCLDFDTDFESEQLQHTAHWKGILPRSVEVWPGPTANLTTFKVLDIPYMSIEQCISNAAPGFRKYITSDKFCAGQANGTPICLGNSGVGLSFPEKHGGIVHHYLRGVAAGTSSLSGQKDVTTGRTCSAPDVVIFTQVNKHEDFIREYFDKSILSGKCVLPPYPENGRYSVANAPYATPGQGYQSLQLNVTCNSGYGVLGSDIISCQGGTWSEPIPECVRVCKLDKHPSVHYHCLVFGDIEGRRNCSTMEPPGTVVRPECNSPNYYSFNPLPFMRCNDDGSWTSIAVCNPECGRVTPDGVGLIIDGRPALRGELPWHVGIYRKSSKPEAPPQQICGGSLVSNSVVISAAHCFWTDVGKQQPAANYAVAIAKLYRGWNNPEDKDAQKSDVQAINIPPRFLGSQANFQEDIAVVVLKTPFVYHTYVRPVCLNFDLTFTNRQLQDGKLGKVAGWGLTGEDGQASRILKVVELPYVNIKQCIDQSPLSFREHITGDKICAGYLNGTALCKGDSGGGLAFSEPDRGTDRYYLRGVVSSAPRSEQHTCNAYTFTAFTELSRHQDFINKFM